MNKLILALEKTIKHLNNADQSDWSSLIPREARESLESELTKITEGKAFNKLEIRFLYAPTSGIQEITISNNWHDEYIEISNVIDKFTE